MSKNYEILTDAKDKILGHELEYCKILDAKKGTGKTAGDAIHREVLQAFSHLRQTGC